MRSYQSQKQILSEFYPLHRTLASEGMDETYEIISKYMPESSGYAIETYIPGRRVWTWIVPERYVVHEAYLENEEGERLVDFANNPLHIVSFSLPTDRWLSFQELESHLYFSAKRPHAVPWMFKFYERGWGFCMSKDLFDRLPRHIRYHAVIRSEFITDPAQGFRVAAAVVHPEGGRSPDAGEIILCAHTCHPNQVNDDAVGVTNLIELAHRLVEKPLPPGSMSVRFLFCPETIGSIAYLAHHEDLIPNLKGGLFMEMTGVNNSLILQHSRQETDLMDRISRYVLKGTGKEFREGEFVQVVANDEKVIDGPGVNVPMVSISRWPYDEYHTTDDNLDITNEELLVEACDVGEKIIRIAATNYIPKRKFRGPVFLSGYGLWVDWRVNWALNRALEKVMYRFEGKHSIFDIAEELNLDYWEIRDYIEKFRVNDLVSAQPIPFVGDTA